MKIFPTYNEIVTHTKTLVTGQDEAVERIALVMFKHLVKNHARVSYNLNLKEVNNALVMGGTGSGKTFIIKTICEYVGLPMLVIDGTNLNAGEGWSGTNCKKRIDNYLSENTHALKGMSVIFIDEFDKTASNRNSCSSGDINFLTQSNILTLLEDTKVGKNDEYSTNNFLFFLAGAFEGIEPKKENSIGFTENKKGSTEELENLLLNYGVIPELLGRLTHLIKLKDLTREDLKGILVNKNSSNNKWVELLKGFGLKLQDSVVDRVVEKAFFEKRGARSLIKSYNEEIDKELINNKDNLNIETLENLINDKNNNGDASININRVR